MPIDGVTRLYAVIADPVYQLRTPELLNPIFDSMDANIVAFPFHVSAPQLRRAWDALRRVDNLAGIGVAIPHKQAVVELCDETDTYASVIGVVSAVRREADGTMVGVALDGPGFVNGLRAVGHQLVDKEVLLIGTGGAGTAIAFALADEGVSRLAVSNRTAEKADALCSSVNKYTGVQLAATSCADPLEYDVVINATSLGLHRDDPMPLEVERLRPGQLVVDAIAKPSITALLNAAQEIGCNIHSGEHMIREHMKLVARFITNQCGGG